MSGITNPAFDLWFHPVRGKAITFEKNFTEAKRNEDYFEHAVVFSERPINVNEVVSEKSSTFDIVLISVSFHYGSNYSFIFLELFLLKRLQLKLPKQVSSFMDHCELVSQTGTRTLGSTVMFLWVEVINTKY